jgi:hypothetical protein
VGWVCFPAWAVEGLFLFTTLSRLALSHIPFPTHWVLGSFSLGVTWPGCEADQSPPSSAEVQNLWYCTSSPPVCLHDVVLSLTHTSYSTQVLTNMTSDVSGYKLTPWCRVLLEKLIVTQLAKKSLPFVELKSSLHYLQEPTTSLYSQPDASIPPF